METRDWALVVFTVLSQAAVGALLTLQVLPYLPSRRGAQEAAYGMARPLLVVLAVLYAGLFAALFHLATPLQAARAVVNFGTSWLSREIVFGSLFAALLTAHVAMAWRSDRGSPWTGWVAWTTAAAALAFLYCQIEIYRLASQPAWNSFATPMAFAATALRLGILGIAVGLVATGMTTGGSNEAARARPVGTPWTTLRWLAVAGLLVLAAELVIVPLHLASLDGDGSPAAAASARRLTEDYGGVLLLRLALLGVAVVTLAGVLLSTGRPASRLAGKLTYIAFAVVLLSELCGRFLFYATRVRVGI